MSGLAGWIEWLRGRCPECGSRRRRAERRLEQAFEAAAHQAYESTAGWVYGHRDVQVRVSICSDCAHEYGRRVRTLKRVRARGAESSERYGGYATR